MKVQIVSKSDNPLFNRIEVQFRLDHDGSATPSRKELRNVLGAQLGAKDNKLVVVKSVNSAFGYSQTTGVAFLYKSEAEVKKYEPDYILKRHEEKKTSQTPEKSAEPPAGEEENKPAPVETPAEGEAPAEEEKKEEPPVEAEAPKNKSPAEEEEVKSDGE